MTSPASNPDTKFCIGTTTCWAEAHLIGCPARPVDRAPHFTLTYAERDTRNIAHWRWGWIIVGVVALEIAAWLLDLNGIRQALNCIWLYALGHWHHQMWHRHDISITFTRINGGTK